jgi:hypothetical protein
MQAKRMGKDEGHKAFNQEAGFGTGFGETDQQRRLP